MAITRIHTTTAFNMGSGSSKTQAITSTTSGNLIVVLVSSATPLVTDPPGITSITDDAGNTYFEVPGALGSINQIGVNIAWATVWYAKNSIAGATSVTITPNANFSGGLGLIAEYSGVEVNTPVVDGEFLSSASGNPSLGPVLTTAHATDLLVSTIYKFGSVPTGVMSPWALFPSSFGSVVEAIAPGAPGTYQAVFTPAQTDGYVSSGAAFTEPLPFVYSFFRSITIDHTKVGTLDHTDQTDFPVLVSFTDTTLKTVANGGHVQNANGYDIAFASDSSNASPLFWEIESYDGTTGTVVAWVKVPTVSHTSNTIIYVLYGNSLISSFQSDITQVWDSNYLGVYHLGNSSGLSLLDSTSHHLDGTNNGATSTSGQIGLAAAFTGGSNITVGTTTDFNLTTAGTVSCWFSKTDSSFGTLIGKSSFNTDRDGYTMAVGSSNLYGELDSASASQPITGVTGVPDSIPFYGLLLWNNTLMALKMLQQVKL